MFVLYFCYTILLSSFPGFPGFPAFQNNKKGCKLANWQRKKDEEKKKRVDCSKKVRPAGPGKLKALESQKARKPESWKAGKKRKAIRESRFLSSPHTTYYPFTNKNVTGI